MRLNKLFRRRAIWQLKKRDQTTEINLASNFPISHQLHHEPFIQVKNITKLTILRLEIFVFWKFLKLEY